LQMRENGALGSLYSKMMTFKSKVKDGKLEVLVKVPASCVVLDKEEKIIKTNSIRGLLKLGESGRKSFSYMGPAAIPLKEALKKPLSKYEFFYLNIQILDLFRKIEKYDLNPNNIILDLSHVYMNTNTKELLFIYIPANMNGVSVGVTDFMEQLILAAEYEDEDDDYVAEYINYVNALDEFDIFEIEQYISCEDALLAKRIAHNRYTSSHLATGKGKTQNVMAADSNEDKTDLLEAVPQSIPEHPTKRINVQNVISGPCLIRKSTNEHIDIKKVVFRMGKERSCVDLFVNDNAVSRKHADIITRGRSYYICDQNSTNHTYVNGVVMPPKEEVEIFDGDIIKLAEEEFIFHA